MAFRTERQRRTDSERSWVKDKKSGFELLEHVTGGVHVTSSPDNGRVVHRPLDDLSDAEVISWDIPLAGPRKRSRKRRQQP